MGDLNVLKKAIDSLTAQVKMLQKQIVSSDFSKQDSDLSIAINNLKSDFSFCKNSLNEREQYPRNWSSRFSGVSIPKDYIEKYGVDGGCMRYLYETLIKPTLECTTPEKIQELNLSSIPQLAKVPKMTSVIENAHFLGGPTKSKKNSNLLLPPSIICRFSSRWVRNLFLRLKREHMPKPTDADVAKGISYYSVTPDLTRLNYQVLSSLRQDSRVKSVWSIDGRIRFCLVKDQKIVYQVNQVLSSTAEILKSCASASNNSFDNATSLVKKRVAGNQEDSSQVTSQETSQETSRETSKETSQETRRETSLETSRETSQETSQETSRENRRVLSRSPVAAEMRAGRRQAPIGTRNSARAEIETNQNK